MAATPNPVRKRMKEAEHGVRAIMSKKPKSHMKALKKEVKTAVKSARKKG